MIRELLEWVAVLLPPPRVIFDRAGKLPYLSRYYLLGAPTMPDGSDAFDAGGAPREGAVYPLGRNVGVYLHHFHRGDDELELHSHPWAWAVSLVLAGGYLEERRVDRWGIRRVLRREVRPGHINIIRADDFHRVELLEHDAWSLFISGPKVKTWYFWNRRSGRVWPWREFINEVRDPTAFDRERRRVS